MTVLSGAITQRQKRNRAFAAELLAPAEAIEKRIGSNLVNFEDVEEIGREFCVSSYVIAHQIENHGLGTIVGSSGLP